MSKTKTKSTVSRRLPGAKSEETRARILEAALRVFRERGFERATMREIASDADVAVGLAYYYFESKDAIVMAFYAQSQERMKAHIDQILDRSRTLEERLRGIITEKFDHFAPNRQLLGALSAHTDPEHPLSPFSRETAAIRGQDIVAFERAVEDSNVKLPPSILPYLPRLLWLYQMGLILFWVYDRSKDQKKTKFLFVKTLKMLVITLRIASIPLLRPLHRLAGEILEVVYNES